MTAPHTTSSTLAVSMLQQLQDAGLMQQLPDMLWGAADAVHLATAPDGTCEPNVLLKMADDLLEISERVVLLHRGLRAVLQARAVLAPPTCGLIHTAMRLFSGHLPTLQQRQQQHDPNQQHQHQQQPLFCSVCQRLADTECMQQAASVAFSAKEMVLDLENAFSALRGVPAALLEVPQLQQLVSSPDLVPFLVLQLAVVSQGLLVQQPLQELRAAAAAEEAGSRRGRQPQRVRGRSSESSSSSGANPVSGLDAAWGDFALLPQLQVQKRLPAITPCQQRLFELLGVDSITLAWVSQRHPVFHSVFYYNRLLHLYEDVAQYQFEHLGFCASEQDLDSQQQQQQGQGQEQQGSAGQRQEEQQGREEQPGREGLGLGLEQQQQEGQQETEWEARWQHQSLMQLHLPALLLPYAARLCKPGCAAAEQMSLDDQALLCRNLSGISCTSLRAWQVQHGVAASSSCCSPDELQLWLGELRNLLLLVLHEVLLVLQHQQQQPPGLSPAASSESKSSSAAAAAAAGSAEGSSTRCNVQAARSPEQQQGGSPALVDPMSCNHWEYAAENLMKALVLLLGEQEELNALVLQQQQQQELGAAVEQQQQGQASASDRGVSSGLPPSHSVCDQLPFICANFERFVRIQAAIAAASGARSLSWAAEDGLVQVSTGCCVNEDERSVLVVAVLQAGLGSAGAWQFFSLLCSWVKLCHCASRELVLTDGMSWTAAEAAFAVVQCLEGAREGGRDEDGEEGVSGVDLLPCVVILGRCCLLWADVLAALPADNSGAAAAHPAQGAGPQHGGAAHPAQGAGQLAAGTALLAQGAAPWAAGLTVSTGAGPALQQDGAAASAQGPLAQEERPAHPAQGAAHSTGEEEEDPAPPEHQLTFRRFLSYCLGRAAAAAEAWLPACSAQLSAAGYPCPDSWLQHLLAAEAAAAAVQEAEGKAVAAQCAMLVQELRALGQASCLFAVPLFCNNPRCMSLHGETEISLVSGRACVCGGCRVARYCGRECLRQHWQQHKPVCKALAAAAAAAAVSVPDGAAGVVSAVE
jgi:hypothetical protein